ncbi:hypothetical protein C8R43DRAFT_1117775 [Mycena crocata]|nr:hypothetical protein C8R43DRAFT_1117775 [Mycena crocata]
MEVDRNKETKHHVLHNDDMGISVHTQYFAGSDATQTGMVVQVTVLENSYMIWGGSFAGEEKEKTGAVEMGRLAKDWAVGMPPLAGGKSTGTTLFAGNAALSMACRLGEQRVHCVYV